MSDTNGEQKAGEKVSQCLNNAPGMMAELMTEFIGDRNLNARVKVRLRMKALLDLVAVDTVYPKAPGMDLGGRRDRAGQFHAAAPQPAVPMDLGVAMGDRVGGGGLGGPVLPIPGAEPINNDDVLGD